MSERKTKEIRSGAGGSRKPVLLILILILLCASASLIHPTSRKFEGEKIDGRIAVTGDLSWPDLSGPCQLVFEDGSVFDGQLKDGRFYDDGNIRFQDGSHFSGKFTEASIESPRLSFSTGESWERDETGWRRIEDGNNDEKKN